MKTVQDVVERMREIDRSLDPDDGVACFNRVYLRVTELVLRNLEEGFFADPEFVRRLDVVFADLYFGNVDDALAGRRPDRCWRPLFEAREDGTVWPLQFVLAGMNAHINHDLALAVIATCAERGLPPGREPVRADFLKVNGLLARIESEVRRDLEPHLLRVATRDAETIKHIVGSFSVARARDMAWCTVENLWPQRNLEPLYDASVAVLSQAVGVVGRLLVTPVVPPPDLG
ncbi:DUF5995 family protein [Spirillospora sp. NPDC127200]